MEEREKGEMVAEVKKWSRRKRKKGSGRGERKGNVEGRDGRIARKRREKAVLKRTYVYVGVGIQGGELNMKKGRQRGGEGRGGKVKRGKGRDRREIL